VTNQIPVTKVFASGSHHQASTREDGNQDHKNVAWSETPEPGWSVVRGTSKLNVNSAQGVWSYSYVSDDGNKVIYSVTTIHKSAGSSGSVDFTISFTETKNIARSEDRSYTKDLRWGDSISFQYPAGRWKLIFEAFDGSHNEFTGADSSNPFIKIHNQQGSWVISTADPKTLNWP